MHREVRHGYTNSDGYKNKWFTMVERSTKKTQFEVERSTPEAFLMLKIRSADRGVQRIQRRAVSRCNEKRGMAGRSTGQKTMEEKKVKLLSRIRKKHTEAQSTKTQERMNQFLNHPPVRCSKKDPLKVRVEVKTFLGLSRNGRTAKTTVGQTMQNKRRLLRITWQDRGTNTISRSWKA